MCMTTLIGISYTDGLVMASDLLATSSEGQRTEQRKIYSTNDVVIGYRGIVTHEFWTPLEENFRKLHSSHSIDAFIKRELARYHSALNLSMKRKALGNLPFKTAIGLHLTALVGTYHNQNFDLWVDYGWGNPLLGYGMKRVNGEVNFSPSRGFFPIIHQESQHINEHQALEFVIWAIRTYNQRYPELSSGLEAVQMTRHETKRALYEPIAK